MSGTMKYPVTLTRDDNDTFLVRFPDVPEAITYGDTREDALARAGAALLTVFDAFMKDRRDVPGPSTTTGLSIEVPTRETTKIDLYRAMRATSQQSQATWGRRTLAPSRRAKTAAPRGVAM